MEKEGSRKRYNPFCVPSHTFPSTSTKSFPTLFPFCSSPTRNVFTLSYPSTSEPLRVILFSPCNVPTQISPVCSSFARDRMALAVRPSLVVYVSVSTPSYFTTPSLVPNHMFPLLSSVMQLIG